MGAGAIVSRAAQRVAIVPLLFLVAGLFVPGSGHAADDKRAKEAQRRLQQQTQQLQAEKSRLEQEKASLGRERDALNASLAEKAATLARTAAALNAKTRAEQELASKLADLEQRHEQLQQLQKETAESLRLREADKKRLETVQAEQLQVVARQARMLDDCAERNGKLHAAGMDLLEKYRGKSCLSVFLESEPVTGLGKVDAENMLQKYRETLDGNKTAVAEGNR